MSWKTISAALLCVAVLADVTRGVVIVNLVLDPPTVAGGGSTSNQSGAGRWHLFALDLASDSLGIAEYSINLQGATSIFHRSPSTLWHDSEGGQHDAGFRIARSSINVSPIRASQPAVGAAPVLISGFGREASSFEAEIPQSDHLSSTFSPSWGNYNTIAPVFGRHWLFLAEGQYAPGAPPSVDPAGTTVQLYLAEFGTREAEVCAGCGLPDFNGNGVVDAADYVLWRKQGGTTAEYAAWRATFGQTAGSGSGKHFIPEPATITLLALAMLALTGLRRRPR